MSKGYIYASYHAAEMIG